MMKIIPIIFTCIFFASCGSGTCNFDLSLFVNGNSSSTANNYWSCNSNGAIWSFAFYNDGTGQDSRSGDFSWERIGCQDVRIEYAGGISNVCGIEGSTASGTATFTQDGVYVACNLLPGPPP
jgi:hypothetical protein